VTGRLDGRRLLLTRSREDSADWARKLAAEGARPLILPCIRTEPVDLSDVAAKLITAVSQADWIVFTSRRGVEALKTLINQVPASARLAGVGDATAASLREHFGRVDMIGHGTAARLATELGNKIKRGERCVLALAENAGEVLPRMLTAAGASVDRFSVYRTIPAKRVSPRRALSTIACDAVIFASPSAVTGFDNQVEVDTARRFVTIGPATSAAVRAYHWTVNAEAKEQSLSGIIDSLLEVAHG